MSLTSLLRADLNDPIRLVNDAAKNLPLVDRQRQRLLGVQVLAGPACRDIDRRVPVLRRAVDDRFNAGTRIEHLVVVLKYAGFSAQGRLGLFRLSEVRIAYSDHVAERLGTLGIVKPAPATDQRNDRPVVLRHEMGCPSWRIGYPIRGESAESADG